TPATRLSNLPTYVFAGIGDRIRVMQQAGIKVIRLDIGSPDAPPPTDVVDALYTAASKAGTHGYSGYRGLPAFREAVARYYQRRFGVTLNPNTEVLPLIGSKEGIVNLCMGYCDRGDTALIPDVGYPSYMQGVRLSGARIEWVPVDAEHNYEVDFAAISPDQRRDAKLIWVNYPNNPTGAVVDLAFYERAVAFCRQNDILLASDNPYCEVTFDGYVAPSALQVEGAKDVTLEFISLSKSHNMAGWRLGAAVGSQHAVETLLKVKSNIDSGHFNAIYLAGAHALDNTPQSWIDARNQTYQRRRDKLMAVLPQIGLTAQTPQATLYVWAKPTRITANQYVEEALTEAHVSLAPGEAYGPGGTEYVRFSVGVTDEEFDQALHQLTTWYTDKYA
ncbi:MAG: aminotransferase class I/II-fold pyridoxal phosphate-dependent enzyme, partial [Anaerolineae bacterium]|nr:aminotransferase class I/II-fold pyridoxal phosphate-dependent enzyme [Anaerolineae bacterium]